MATPVFVGKVIDTTLTGLSGAGGLVTVPFSGSVPRSTISTTSSVIVWYFVNSATIPGLNSPVDDAPYDNTVWGTRWAPWSRSNTGLFGFPTGPPNRWVARQIPTFAGPDWQGAWSVGLIFSALNSSNHLSLSVPSGTTTVHVLGYAVTGLKWVLANDFTFVPSVFNTTVFMDNQSTSSGSTGSNPITNVSGGTITSGDLVISMAEERLGAGSGHSVSITADGAVTIDDYFDIGSGRMAFGHRVATSTVTTESSAWPGSGQASGVIFHSYPGAVFPGTIPDQLTATASKSYVDSGTDRIYTITVTDVSGIVANTTDHMVELLYRSDLFLPLASTNYSNSSVTIVGATYSYNVTVPVMTTKHTEAWLYDGVVSNQILFTLPGQGVPHIDLSIGYRVFEPGDLS